MLDITLRPLKDHLFDPICRWIPSSITPLHLTGLAFTLGMASCISAATDCPLLSLSLWILNRVFDCLDGAVARQRGQASDLGGFLDLLADFTVYSLIPIACGSSDAARDGEKHHLWLAIALLEASFHLNNFVLFFVAAVLEKRKAGSGGGTGGTGKATVGNGERESTELTSVMMRPALIEGTESAVLFTLMLAYPAYTEPLCWSMAVLVGVGIGQRVVWLLPVM